MIRDQLQAVVSRGDMRRRSSINPIPALGRLRIQSCFRQSGPDIGELILKRAKIKKSEFRSFAAKVGEVIAQRVVWACPIGN